MLKKISGRKQFVLISIAIIFCIVGKLAADLIWFKPMNINLFYDRVLLRSSLGDPQTMSSIGLLDKYGLDYYNDELNDPSIESTEKFSNLAEKELKVLRSFDRTKQNDTELLSTDILDWYLSSISSKKDFVYQVMPVNQFSGIQKSLVKFMCNVHVLKNKGDAKDYIERLSQFDDYFNKLISALKEREAKGVIPPTFIITATLSEMKSFISEVPSKNILYTNFKEKVSRINLPDKEKQNLYERVENEIENSVYPGYKRLISYCEELLPKSKEYVGVWSLPDGDKYYASLVKSSTTLDITPEELFNMLETELKKLNERLYTLNSMPSINNNPGAHNLTTLEDFQSVIDNMWTNLDHVVTKSPKNGLKIGYHVTNDTGRYQYFAANVNNNDPAIINVTRDFANLDLYTMKWILYHEGIPGHHLQIALAKELKDVPTFRKVIPFSAFKEGWATYAQNLPWTMGIEKDEGLEKDIIKNRLFQVGKALVDLGINYKRWSRTEAINYALNNNICDLANAQDFVGIYTADPAQGLSYIVGCLKIESLRDYAKADLGAKFDIREFHDNVLKNGAVPLDILDKQIKSYVENKKGL